MVLVFMFANGVGGGGGGRGLPVCSRLGGKLRMVLVVVMVAVVVDGVGV